MKDDKLELAVARLRGRLLRTAPDGLAKMSALANEGKVGEMTQHGLESAEQLLQELTLELRALGLEPDVERWKREARDHLPPEQYLVWEEKVLPWRLQAWLDRRTEPKQDQ